MAFKDYYNILGVKPSASTEEIKRNYRRLAMKYHPDKNPGDTFAEAVFTEIAEAYSILSNPIARDAYDSRNNGSFNAQFNSATANTGQAVANLISNLHSKIAASNHFGINQDALLFQLNQILSRSNIQLLQQLSQGQRLSVISQLVYCCSPLFYPRAQKLSPELFALAGDDETARSAINVFLKTSLRASKWHKYKAILAIVLAIILCALVFLFR